MRKSNILILALCVILAALFIGLLFYRFEEQVETKQVWMHYQVSDKLGFNVDTDALYFGKGLPGSMSKRYVQLNNSHDYPVIVSIKLSGDISPYVSVSENEFEMAAREYKVITYYIQTSKDTPYGNYSGVTSLIFTKKR